VPIVLLAVLAFSAAASGGARGNPIDGPVTGVERYTIKPGSHRAGGGLLVHAKEEIVVKGEVFVPAGANVDLTANVIRIGPGGGIVAVGDRESDAIWELSAGSLLEMDGRIKAGPGTSVKLAVKPDGEAVVTGEIRTVAGRDATRRSEEGGRSGSILVVGGVFGKAERVEIGASARIETGNGGHGYDDRLGRDLGRPNPCHAPHGTGGNRHTLDLLGTDGGRAGDIRLLGRTLVVRADDVEVGRGGDGGFAGAGIHAPNGAAGHAGTDISARSGSGGRGGSIVAPGYRFPAGRGGDAGDVRAGAGNGAPGCDGGETRVALGEPGQNGREGPPPKERARPGLISLADGAKGSEPADADHTGGDGGDVSIGVPFSRPTKAERQQGRKPEPLVEAIRIGFYASGGDGYHDCRKGRPVTRGTDGGAGGRLSAAASVPVDVIGSFNGGDGGEGEPPGSAGPAGKPGGKLVDSTRSFVPGMDGEHCPGTGLLYRYSIPAFAVSFTGPGYVRSPLITDRAEGGSGCGNPAADLWLVPYTTMGQGTPVTATARVSFAQANPFTIVTHRFEAPGAADEERTSLRYEGGASPSVVVEVAATAGITGISGASQRLPVTLVPTTTC
jgi:hypothetical protein